MRVHSLRTQASFLMRSRSRCTGANSTELLATYALIICCLCFGSVVDCSHAGDESLQPILKPGSNQIQIPAGRQKEEPHAERGPLESLVEGSYLWGVSAVIGDAAALAKRGVEKIGSLAGSGGDQGESPNYEADFTGIFPSLSRRQDAGQIGIRNNAPLLKNIIPGSTDHFVFTNESLWGLPGGTSESAGQQLKPTTVTQGSESEESDSDDGEESSLRKRQDDSQQSTRTVYISVNTCLQPVANDSSANPPPQLTLYISQSAENPEPGPSVTDLPQSVIELDEGFALVTIEARSEIFIGIHGPLLPEPFSNPWNCEIAVSTDAPYHTYNDGESLNGDDTDEEDPQSLLFFVDGDARSALLVTDNLTVADADSEEFQRWADIDPLPYIIFAHNRNFTAIRGLQKSFCGLRNRAQISVDRGGNAANVARGMTMRGLGNKPKQQFFIEGLNASSSYVAYIAMMGNSTHSGPGVIGGGGQLWPATSFFTKTDSNCQVIFDLSFCSDVAYAVPSNPRTFPDMPELARLYDDAAAATYQNFTYSLQQIACNTTSTAQYSLVRNCDDCARDYKNWLCAVTIPRCADFSSQDPFLQPRNLGQSFLDGTASSQSLFPGSSELLTNGDNFQAMPEPDEDDKDDDKSKDGEGGNIEGYEDVRPPTMRLYANSSRNPLIDDLIQPGPYKEVLPCDDLCYSLVQSCPAALGFKCPLPGRGLERSYGKRSRNGSITCSYLGAAYYLNDSNALTKGLVPSVFYLMMIGIVAALLKL